MFKTQADVLKHLGKNVNDRSLIQRMLYRWDLIKKDWGYIIVDKNSNIDVVNELQSKLEEKISLVREFAKKNNELEHEIDRLKEELESTNKAQSGMVVNAIPTTVYHVENNNELIDHLRYLYTLHDNKLNALNELIKMYYDRNPNDWWDNAEEKVHNMLHWEIDPNEKDELDFISEIIK